MNGRQPPKTINRHRITIKERDPVTTITPPPHHATPPPPRHTTAASDSFNTMITLHSYAISASIKDRYAICSYLFQFENLNDSGSNELKFELTIDPNAFISKFTADIDGELFVGKTKEKQTASKQYTAAKAKNENAILISQPHQNIPNVFEVKTNIDAKSKVALTIQMEQYLQKTFGFNALDVQILRNFSKYNIEQNFDHISFELRIEDNSGIYDVEIPMTNNNIVVHKQTMDEANHTCEISGVILNKSASPDTKDQNWTKRLKINEKIDVKERGKWYSSVVKEVDTSGNRIKIHFCGYDNKYDEYIGMHEARLAPPHSHTKINELALKYKIKGEQNDSHILFDDKSHTFCHIISDIITDSIITDSIITDEADVDANEGGSGYDLNNTLIPRRVVFVVDRSGSMGGVKWLNTISAMTTAIKQLRNGYDRFGVILFDNNIDILTPLAVADDKGKIALIRILQNQTVDGGTNINDALLKAIELIKSDIISSNSDDACECNFFMNQIIFMTDGQPNGGETNTNNIITNVQKANDLSTIDVYNKKISIFSFGVGNDGNDSAWIKDLNHSFLKLLAVHNHGFYRRIKESSADTKLTECFGILSKPVLSNIAVQYESKNITQLTATKFNTLYCGNDLIICGKIDNSKQHTMDYLTVNVTISATTGKMVKHSERAITKAIKIVKKMKLNIDSTSNDDNNNTERIWAYLKLQQYATEKLMHRNDMIEDDDDEKKEQQALPLSLALQYKFVTPWTSMIVVKQKNTQNVEEDSEELNPNQAFIQRGDVGRAHAKYKRRFLCRSSATSQSHKRFQQKKCKSISRTGGPVLKSKTLSHSNMMNMFNVLQTNQQQVQQQQQKLNVCSSSLMSAAKQLDTRFLMQRCSAYDDEEEEDDSDDEEEEDDSHDDDDSDDDDDDDDDDEDSFDDARVYQHQRRQVPTGQHSVSQLSAGGGGQTSAPMLEVNPLTAEMLQDATPAEKKRLIGERLFPKIQVVEPRLAGKITGMLLEMDNTELLVLLSEQRALMNKIGEALAMIKRKDALEVRLKQEKKDLEAHPIPNCAVEGGDDTRVWKVTLAGPRGSPYHGGVYRLEINIPRDFPLKPPQITFVTKIYHCNIDNKGRIKLDVLGEGWSPDWTIKRLLLAIIQLLSHPNVDDPLVADIAKLYASNRKQHDQIAKQWTQKFANV